MDDQMRALVLMLQARIGKDAGELENAILDGIQSAHFQVDPEELRHEIAHMK